MKIGSLHQQRIRAASPNGREPYVWTDGISSSRAYDAILLRSDTPEDAAQRAVASLTDHGVLFIHGAQHPRFDRVKSRLIEFAHIGPCPDAPGAHLWWGSPRGWGGVDGRAGNLPIIVSYYTTGTPYEDEARELVQTCNALQLEHRVEGVKPRGTWESNCAMKAGFMLDMWTSLQRPMLWVDADARMRRAPELLRGMSADFAVHKAARWQFASGTVFVNATELAGELLQTWRRRCEADPRTWDQVHLDHAWEELSLRAPLETVWLPQSYTRIFDRPDDNDGGGAPVVEHFQASRRLKAVVTAGEPRPFVDFDEATKAARRASRPRAA